MPVIRDYPITPTQAPAHIRDPNRPAPIWHVDRRARLTNLGAWACYLRRIFCA
jgi:hypothetical protein